MNETVVQKIEDAKVYTKYYLPEIKKVAFVVIVAAAASSGARFGVSRAIANGRLQVKR